VELLDESIGACTGGNFLGCRPRVKQHGAILGMQIRRSRLCRRSGRCSARRAPIDHDPQKIAIPIYLFV
jgi:hypothetical protein